MDTKKFLALVEKKKQEAQLRHVATSEWAKKLERAAMGPPQEDSDEKDRKHRKRRGRHGSREKIRHHVSSPDSHSDPGSPDKRRRRKQKRTRDTSDGEVSDDSKDRSRRKKRRRSHDEDDSASSLSDDDRSKSKRRKDKKKRREGSGRESSCDKAHSTEDKPRKHRKRTSVGPDSDSFSDGGPDDRQIDSGSGGQSVHGQGRGHRSKSKTPELTSGPPTRISCEAGAVHEGAAQLPPLPPRRKSVTPEPHLAVPSREKHTREVSISCCNATSNKVVADPMTKDVSQYLEHHVYSGPQDLQGSEKETELSPQEVEEATRQRALASLAQRGLLKRDTA